VKKIILGASVLGVMILALGFYLANLSFSAPSSCENSGKSTTFRLNDEINQSFIAANENLSGISLKVATGGKFYNLGSLGYSLEDREGNLLFSGSQSTLYLENDKDVNLPFPGVKLGKGQEYNLVLSYLSQPRSKISLWATEGDCYPGVLRSGSGNGKSGDLIMHPRYSPGSFMGNLIELSQRLSQYKPFWLKGWASAVAFLIYLGLLSWLIAEAGSGVSRKK